MGGVERCWKLLVRAVAFTRGGMDRQLDSSRNRLAPSSPTADCVLGRSRALDTQTCIIGDVISRP